MVKGKAKLKQPRYTATDNPTGMYGPTDQFGQTKKMYDNWRGEIVENKLYGKHRHPNFKLVPGPKAC